MGRREFLGFLIFAAFTFTAMGLMAQEDKSYFEPFNVYTDKSARGNHYIPSGYMGDYRDVSIVDGCQEDPYSGQTCMKITYRPDISQGARWVGVYWQYPPNNWGEKKGGFDLTGAKKLSFWARGEKGGERIEEFKIGGISGTYSDSDMVAVGPIVLSQDWQQYEINLSGRDLSYISGGFCFSTNIDVNPDGCVFYLDDICYE